VPPLNFNNQTLRQIVRTSVGGDRIRVILSNVFGTAPLAIGGASVAVREKEAAIVPKSDRMLAFGGSPSTVVPAGAVVFSDPVNLTVSPQTDLAIDLYLPGDTASTPSPVATHIGALQTNFVSATGNHVAAPDLPVMTTTQAWFFLARVEVMTTERTGTIVTFGDSITDGTRSTANANKRWPDYLARRLMKDGNGAKWGVLNAGIAGNRVLSDGAGVSALARFDRDALLQTGVTHVIVLEGINDIGFARSNPSPSVADLIAGHRQLIERAHARGLRIYGATLLPFEGAAYWTAEGEAKRQALNEWIRTSKAYDGVIDFDAAVRDPRQPTILLSMYDSGDRLHPSDAGYEAMANMVDLDLFKTR
jgi:lysophospholipase L1-like esterase